MMVSKLAFSTFDFDAHHLAERLARSGSTPTIVLPSAANDSIGG